MNWAIGGSEVAFGLFLALPCSRAAMREHRAGIAEGRHGRYPRGTQPVRFWVAIVMTFLAGVIGVVFVTGGIPTAVYGI